MKRGLAALHVLALGVVLVWNQWGDTNGPHGSLTRVIGVVSVAALLFILFGAIWLSVGIHEQHNARRGRFRTVYTEPSGDQILIKRAGGGLKQPETVAGYPVESTDAIMARLAEVQADAKAHRDRVIEAERLSKTLNR